MAKFSTLCIYLLYVNLVSGYSIQLDSPPPENVTTNDFYDFDTLITARLTQLRRKWPTANVQPLVIQAFPSVRASTDFKSFNNIEIHVSVGGKSGNGQTYMTSSTGDGSSTTDWDEPRQVRSLPYDTFSWGNRGGSLQEAFTTLRQRGLLSPFYLVFMARLMRSWLPSNQVYFIFSPYGSGRQVLIGVHDKRVYPYPDESGFAANESALMNLDFNTSSTYQ